MRGREKAGSMPIARGTVLDRAAPAMILVGVVLEGIWVVVLAWACLRLIR